MNQNCRVLFNLKKGKGYTTGPLPIYVRITIDGKRTEWSVQRSWEVQRWNKKPGRATGNKIDALELNHYLDIIQGNIYNVQKEYALRNERISSEQVKIRLLNKEPERKHKLVEVFKYHNEQFSKMVGKEYSLGTLKKFRTALQSLQKFISWKFSKEDVFLSEM